MPPARPLNGLYLAQVAVGALGVLVVTGEYGSGLIRATFSAVPRRRTALFAKGLVFTTATLVVGEVLSFAAFGLGQAILTPTHVGASLGSPGALRAVTAGGLYLAAVGLLGFGIGATVRRTAGALSAFFGIFFALDAVVDLLPTRLRHNLIDYLPANAGSQILTTHRTDGLHPWTGYLVLCLYAAVAVAVGMVLVSVRDGA